MGGLCQYNLGIGAVTRTDLAALGRTDGCLYLKLVGTIVFYSLRRDIFQVSLEVEVLQGSDGNLHRHSCNETSHFGFIDIATENKVVHVGYAGDGSTIVESVGKNHRVTHLDRNIEDNARDGRTDEGGRSAGIALAYTITHHLESIFGSRYLLACLFHSLLYLIKLIGADQLFLEELFFATIIHLCLF